MSADIPEFKRLLAEVAGGGRLNLQDARLAFDIMMSGNATPSQMGGFLMALRARGETVEEINGSEMTLRTKVLGVKAQAEANDTIGQGGDAMHNWKGQKDKREQRREG